MHRCVVRCSTTLSAVRCLSWPGLGWERPSAAGLDRLDEVTPGVGCEHRISAHKGKKRKKSSHGMHLSTSNSGTAFEDMTEQFSDAEQCLADYNPTSEQWGLNARGQKLLYK